MMIGLFVDEHVNITRWHHDSTTMFLSRAVLKSVFASRIKERVREPY